MTTSLNTGNIWCINGLGRSCTMQQCNASSPLLPWGRSLCLEFNTSLTNITNSTVAPPVGKSVAIGVLFGTIAIGAMIGNVLVILSVFTNRRLRTVTNCFVVSLASSDLLVAVFVMPLAIKVEITGTWNMGVIFCDMWVSCDVMLCTASILNLCCISLDRYFAITTPLVYATRRSKRLALIMIAVVWVAAIVITCPSILGWQEAGRWEDDSDCTLTSDPGYIIYSALGSFFLPLLIMIFVYARIFKVASQREKNLISYKRSFKCGNNRKRTKFRDAEYCYRTESVRLTDPHRETEREEDEDTDIFTDSTLVQQDNDHTGKCLGVHRLHEGLIVSSALAMTDIARAHRQTMRQKSVNSNSSVSTSSSPSACRKSVFISRKDDKRRERAVLIRERKTAKTLAIVVGCFVLCWLPFFLMYVIGPFCSTCAIPPTMNTFFTWLGYFNSLINPFIYALYNKDFRYSFWRLTCGLLYRKRI